ncbi:MAG TPA: Eco57I restriction-modification methylase domain-containing protein [Candidatus Cloacimonadota bacterium]|nr:Eco57I restriction-modification methylase domain-containing protein [Candidatus Cloacimonadota bacterium]HQL15547.1 Eco57I restriction-modification methylase domain-containing protein [Candidatus Cloacimonadota bacterium]
MVINKTIVLPKNFTQQNWINYFDSNSSVYVEASRKAEKFDNTDFSQVTSIGYLEFNDGGRCNIYLLKSARSLTERIGRKKQFDKAIDIIKKEHLHSGLFIFYDTDNSFRFSLIYPIYKGTKRAFSNYRRHSFYVSASLSNKTYLLQLSKYSLNSLNEVKEAFSVDKVSALFYDEFEQEYEKLKAGIKQEYNQPVTDEVRGNFALLFVIRIIFLGFVQKKGWLDNNPNFIRDFINSYTESKQTRGIYQDLLSPLFFNALNSSPLNKHKSAFSTIPEPFKAALASAPYLNGGLFRKHDDFDLYALYITDDAIKSFVSFLFSYNFTLEENTLYDEELELNPEFLGIIFEKLINKQHGAIYTPRLEVDFMCRLSLVKYLQQNCPASITLENLYKLFFPEYSNENEQTIGDFSPEEAQSIINLLEHVTVCDPAIGSGAFAVGMLNVIDEIECTLYRYCLNKEIPSAYERKKRIIFQSLYGVEIKQWAVWITQLRLWITLLIEADDNYKSSNEPLLPSFDFKIRQGDSLIQMLGSSLFPVSGKGILKDAYRRKINELMKLKTDYYYNKCPHKLQDIEVKQSNLYIEILRDQQKDLKLKLDRIRNEGKKEVQTSFLDTDTQGEIDFADKKQLREIRDLQDEITELDEEISSMHGELPFFWRIDFPEVIIEKSGFDIVIGNPPYVAQEEIEDPLDRIKPAKVYKDLLKQMVIQDFGKDIPLQTINGKSDLYAFFYIRGIRLLNDKGVLTLISSNSWLDVEFGAWMQKFLLEHCQVYFIIDNLANRVFKSADINTIISVIGARKTNVKGNDMIRFAAFKLPFENSLYTENLLMIEEAQKRIDIDDIRINPVTRTQLTLEGWENSSENKYSGSKWGSIYIKAPDIYFKILEKAGNKLVKLKDIADVKFGVKTGADEFFYIPKSNPNKIEKEFLKPVIKSPRECKSILINPDELNFWLFMCPYEKNEIKGTNALKYIEWAETAPKYIKQGKDKGTSKIGFQNISSVQGRKNWYDLGERVMPELITPSSFSDTFKVFINNGVYANKRLYEIHCTNNVEVLALLLNTTLFSFFLEINASASLGEGLLDKTVNEVETTYVLNPDLVNLSSNSLSMFNSMTQREIYSIFKELQIDPDKDSFNNANPLSDRKAIDDIVFQILGLTKPEIKTFYASMLELTANRLRKARTFTS